MSVLTKITKNHECTLCNIASCIMSVLIVQCNHSKGKHQTPKGSNQYVN
nr:MAG TPA: hypothetical protein [Caudoviricetes sp.]